MEYQPERYLKDGKLNPAVMDSASVAFGFGRRSVDYISQRDISHGESSPVLVLEDTLATTGYIQLCPVFSQYMTSDRQLMIRALPSSLSLSSPAQYCRKHGHIYKHRLV